MSLSMVDVQASTGRPSFDVHESSFRYGGNRRGGSVESASWAVRDVTFAVKQGEIFGVIGPNGSGKSSLLKVLAKMVAIQMGEVRLFEVPLQRWSREAIARQVAYMPQDVSSDFAFLVLDVVLMGRFPYRAAGTWNPLNWERREDHVLVQQAMIQADVAHLANREMATLSAGERQRVLLARALAQEPRVLLLDEPTAHLDLQHQLDFCRILKRVHDQQGMTVVLVSHDINLASQYCDRILMMKDGRLAHLGSPHDVVTRPNLEEVYGCHVLIDGHPETGRPRVCLPRQGEAAGGGSVM